MLEISAQFAQRLGKFVTDFQSYEKGKAEFTQAFSLGWYVATPLALIRSLWKCAWLFRRANGPDAYQHGVKPHE